MRDHEWRRVAELFQQALEQPREHRRDFLRRACGDDTALLDSVVTLLAADAKASDFLESPMLVTQEEPDKSDWHL
ncbi:MAG: hypothetical protein AAGF23_26795 [Acidobacteriota bacterium]